MPSENNNMILEFPLNGIEFDLGTTATFDDISGYLNTERLEGNFPADRTSFDNTDTDLESTDTESAIKEVNTKVNTKADASSVYSKTETDNKLANKANVSDVYDKTYMDGIFEQIDNAFTGVNTELGKKADKVNTYTKTEVDNIAAAKADKADTYTKAQVDTALGNKANSSDVYTKTQADDKFATKTSLATVATSGSYNDLLDKPSIPAAQVNSDWNSNSGVSQILNKPNLATVATTGDYNDLNNKPSVAVIDDTEASASKVFSSSKVVALLGDKANVDGEYNDMVVGNAKQLKSNVGENDKVPYLFRTSGGSIDIGESEEDTLVGGTVAFNQLVKIKTTTAQGINASIDANGVIEFSGTSTGGYSQIFENYQPIVGHKYYVASKYVANPSEFTDLYFAPFNASSNPSFSSKKIGAEYITNCINSTGSGFGISGFNANTDLSGTKIKAQFIDLTQMFGSTIADYIYSLEQGTAGAGVAWFRNLFPKDYYAYNAGELMSVKTSKHIMTGFNAWDEQWELGYIDNNGNKASSTSRFRCKNPIRVIPNSTYYVYSGSNKYIYMFFYDVDGNFIQNNNKRNETLTVPSNAYTLEFCVGTEYGATYNHDICINLSWDGERNGEYEPYVKHEYDYSGEREVERYFGIVDLGTLTYNRISTDSYYYCNPSGYKVGSTNFVIADFTNKGQGIANLTENKTAVSFGGQSNRIVLRWDEHLTDTAQQFATALSGKYLIYELATPYTETVSNPELRGIPKLDANNKLYYYGDTCSDLPNPQAVDGFGTEEYEDNRTVAIPVGHYTFYQSNLRAKLEMAPDSPSGDGDYIVRQSNGQNEYVPLVKELPTLPSSNGTYTLKCTVSGSSKTLSWVADT